MGLSISSQATMKEKGNYIADISALGNLRAVEQLDLSAYKDVKESTFRLPAEGVYTFQAPESFPAAAFGATKNGDLSVQIDPKIAEGEHAGFQLRFIKVSAKVYEDKNRGKVSQLGDYLRACGYKGSLNSPQEQADAAEQTANMTYRAKAVWRARNGNTGFVVQGMTKFPKLADGTYQSWIEDPTEKDADGRPVKVRANLVIDRFYPQD